MRDSDPLQALQGDALDLVRAEHDALAPRLGSADRALLQPHADLVRDLEPLLAGMASTVCDIPAPNFTKLLEDNNDEFEVMVELIRVVPVL